MAIAYGGIGSVGTTQSSNTGPTVTGADTVGIVLVAGDSGADNITAATWGGVSMAKIGAVQVPGDRWISAWWVANPSSGGTLAFTGGSFWRSVGFYYTGASQVGQPDSSNTGTVSSNTSLTVVTTVVAPDCWAVLTGKDNGGGRTNTSTTGTVRLSTDAGGLTINDSNATVSTGSVNCNSTISSSANMGAIAFSIKPPAAAVSSIKSADGVTLANIKSADGVNN